ncbi:MAG: hypothetical protein GEV09_22155 [Pseudonocardiaceae bacterium]|nr:hypothetical protein [Pseudonocardiaceae bacterium]
MTCGDAHWPAAAAGVRVIAVGARPDRDELAAVLERLDGARLVVCGTDADLAAVVLRLLRAEMLGVSVGYVPTCPSSVVARLWSLPVAPTAAAGVALRGRPHPVPLLRDDSGGVLVGLGVVAPVRGVAYCDDELVLRGQASRLEVTPDPQRGLLVRVVRRGWLGRRVRMAAGRAVQLGCEPTGVVRDGVPRQTPDRWTWYRHTEELRLVRAHCSP